MPKKGYHALHAEAEEVCDAPVSAFETQPSLTLLGYLASCRKSLIALVGAMAVSAATYYEGSLPDVFSQSVAQNSPSSPSSDRHLWTNPIDPNSPERVKFRADRAADFKLMGSAKLAENGKYYSEMSDKMEERIAALFASVDAATSLADRKRQVIELKDCLRECRQWLGELDVILNKNLKQPGIKWTEMLDVLAFQLQLDQKSIVETEERLGYALQVLEKELQVQLETEQARAVLKAP